MSELGRFYSPNNAVTVTDVTLDGTVATSTNPLSFIEWIRLNAVSTVSYDQQFARYNEYINSFFNQQHNITDVSQFTIREQYTALVNEIVLNYTSTEERRFLKNLDFNNPHDVIIAVPFFARKVRDICMYFSTLRDKVKTAATEYSLKGSNIGLQKLIYNEISKTLETQDLTELTRTLNLTLSSIRNNTVIEIEELYDNNSNYFDISTPTASAYNATGERAENFILNFFEVDPNLYLNFNSAIVSAITSYPFYLTELGTNNFTVIPTIDATQLDLLKDADFINLINNNTQANLKLNLLAALNKKYMGTDFYYVSTGSTVSNVVSGLLFKADAPFANYLNKLYPTVAFVPNLSGLKTAKQQGLFFKPDKIGFLNFNNFNFTSFINSDKLSENAVYVFPDPTKFGNIIGNTKENQFTPLDFIEDNSVVQADFTNSYLYGDAKSDPLLPTLRGYQSREQSLLYNTQGISRYIDPQDFFKGFKKDTWANSDIYKQIPVTEFPIASRLDTLVSIDKTLVQYKSDVYGNDYGLYKYVNRATNTSDILSARDAVVTRCLILSGDMFTNTYITNNDLQSLSGIILKTTNNIPPGTGYYTPSYQFYNMGSPHYALTGAYFFINSYRYQPEVFCQDFIKNDVQCFFKDAYTFINANGTALVDSPSDATSFDPYTTVTYYDELIEAATNPMGPQYRANFAFAPTFLYTAPSSAVQLYDCSYFIISGFTDYIEPCKNALDNLGDNSDFVMQSNYVNYNIPLRQTAYLPTVAGPDENKTIYETRFANYGSFYFRNNNSSLVIPVSSALSGIFLKYPTEILHELNHNVINFDLFYDVIQIETENYLVFDKLTFDPETATIGYSTHNETYITRGNTNPMLEKTSTIWFNEKENLLLMCSMMLHPVLSASNFKAIYPVIYTLDLNRLNITQLYPSKNISTLTFEDVSTFSLSGTNQDIDITRIDKPILTYNTELDQYTISYFGKDTSNLSYLFVIDFKYINGVLTNISNRMYRPTIDLSHVNFGNPHVYNYGTYYVTGSSSGAIINGEFEFGA